jgi:hypothetical protein
VSHCEHATCQVILAILGRASGENMCHVSQGDIVTCCCHGQDKWHEKIVLCQRCHLILDQAFWGFANIKKVEVLRS